MSNISWFTKLIETQTKTDEVAIRLMALPGVGPIVSSALKGWMGDGQQFAKAEMLRLHWVSYPVRIALVEK